MTPLTGAAAAPLSAALPTTTLDRTERGRVEGAATAPDRTERGRDQAAKGFERMLLEQLTGELLEPVGLSGPYASLLPRAAADAILAGGGLGLGEALIGDALGGGDPRSAEPTTGEEAER
jgi:hypothetical protein